MESKKDIRKRKEEIRKDFSLEQRKEWSNAIFFHFKQLPIWKSIKNIYGYASIKEEVESWNFFDEALNLNKNIWLPRVMGENMDFFAYQGISSMEKSAFGILEPGKDSPKASFSDGVFLVPALSVDERGYRLGYGGGYYDKCLSQHPDLLRVGILYEICKEKVLPIEPFDVPLDILITEEGVTDFRILEFPAHWPKDPMILVSFLNTRIRNEYQTLEVLCEENRVKRRNLMSYLSDWDFEYDEEIRRFM